MLLRSEADRWAYKKTARAGAVRQPFTVTP